MPQLESHSQLELPHSRAAPGIARSWLADRFAAELGSVELFEQAKLLTSELVTNAVVHGRGKIELRARLDPDRLLVEVIDEGTGFAPRGPVSGWGAIGGFGLAIVESVASRWGIAQDATRVWFEIERPAPRV